MTHQFCSNPAFQPTVQHETMTPVLSEVLFATSPAGVGVIDADLRFLRVNDAFARITGWPSATHIGRSVRDRLPGLALDLEPLLQRVLADGFPIVDTLLDNERGEQPHAGWQARVSVYPLPDADGTILSVAVLLHDVASPAREAMSLHESEARYRDLFEHAHDIVYVLDMEGRLKAMNNAGLQMTGYTLDELIGRQIAEFVQPDDLAIMQRMLERKRDGAQITTYELRIIAKNKQPVNLEVSSRLVFRDGKPYEIHGIARNVTARTRMLFAQRFLSEASHLLASSLDYETTLGIVAEVAVPRLADYCLIDMLSDDGRVHRIKSVHVDPHGQTLIERIARYLELEDVLHAAPQVYRDGQAEIMFDITDHDLQMAARDAEHLEILRALAPHSAILAPMLLRGRVIGVMTLATSMSRRVYNQDDLALVMSLAERAAQAIENAHLYEAEQHARAAAERAATRTTILQTVTAALAQLHTPEQIAEIAMNEGIRILGANAGGLAVLGIDGMFETVRLVGYSNGVVDTWLAQPYALSMDAPIPETVRTGTPIWLESPDQINARYPHIVEQLDADQCGAWATLPLMVKDHAYGGFCFLFGTPRTFAKDDRSFLLALAQQCAQAIERSHLHQAEQQAQAALENVRQRQSMLVEASAALASSLDVQKTLETLAHLVVPQLADWCVIDLLLDDGSISTAAIAHVDPAKEAVGWHVAHRYPIDPLASSSTGAVLRTCQPELLSHISDAMLDSIARDAEHRALLIALEMRSAICVPLIARGRAIGTLALVGATLGRYTSADTPFVEDFAQHAALAIDNAQLYQQAQEAILLRDTFFSVAAHELKTPLTVLLGHAQLIERRVAHDGGISERERHTITVIANQAQRINTMILAMLDSTRLEQGQLSIEHKQVDLTALVQQVVETIEPTLVRHTIICEAQDTPLIVIGDALRLEQVLHNLVENAIKYSPYGGKVLLRLEAHGTQAHILVQDYGLGIPSYALPLLFQRFYRAGNVRAQHISGMGIGLYVVREIANLHGGRVSVESVEDQGSRFSITLPLASAHERMLKQR